MADSGRRSARETAVPPGQVVVLNGAPRSGKSSIVAALQDQSRVPWINLGVDVLARSTPERWQPGIGLRPGGERPDIEPVVAALYAGLFGSVAAHSRAGLNVVVDVGLHDAYSVPLGVLADVVDQLDGLPALLVGVRCPIDVIMERREVGEPGRQDTYLIRGADGAVPPAVLRWQHEVHDPGIYDLEVDTSVLSPDECATAIARRVGQGPGTAFLRIDEWSRRA